jgi:hypothetical protein
MPQLNKKKSLIKNMDDFASKLLDKAGVTAKSLEDGTEVPSASIGEQVSVFNAVREWIRTKHKLDPEDGPADFISKARTAINGAPAKRRKYARHPPVDTGADAGSAPAGSATATVNGTEPDDDTDDGPVVH